MRWSEFWMRSSAGQRRWSPSESHFTSFFVVFFFSVFGFFQCFFSIHLSSFVFGRGDSTLVSSWVFVIQTFSSGVFSSVVSRGVSAPLSQSGISCCTTSSCFSFATSAGGVSIAQVFLSDTGLSSAPNNGLTGGTLGSVGVGASVSCVSVSLSQWGISA